MTHAAFAPVAPIQILEGLYNYSHATFGDYHLLLAHHTIEEEARFRTLFSRIEADKLLPSATIIMDNSIVELGDAVSAEMVKQAYDIIKDSAPSLEVIPVLPDVMGDGNATRRIIDENYAHWQEAIDPAEGFMAVAQGKDQDDFEASVTFLLGGEFEDITWIGIPRILTASVGSRKAAVEFVKEHYPDINIHLLGFSDNMEDDLACAKIEGVDGIDSAVPLRVEGEFTPTMEVGPRPKNWFEEAIICPQMVENLNIVRNTVKAGR